MTIRPPLHTLLSCCFVSMTMILMLATGCQQEDSEKPFRPDVAEIPFPAAAGSGEANISETASGAVVSWIERRPGGGHSLRFARYEANGGWGEPGTIAEGDDWFVNWADFPSIVETTNGRLVAHWLVKSGPATFAYDINFSRLEADGESWSAPAKLHDDVTQTEHGFVSMLPLDDGSVLAAWLDGRAFGENSHRMTLRSRLMHEDGSIGPEMVVDDLVCDCCQTSMAALPGGGAILVYRNRTEDEIRDVYAARFENGRWLRPEAVHEDGWEIAGCPVNGPAVSSSGGEVAAAWFSGSETAHGVFVAYLDENGVFESPVRVDEGRPVGRVDIRMLDDGTALVTWLERNENGEGARILLKQIHRDGTMGTPYVISETTQERISGFPRVSLVGGDLIAVWTDASGDDRHVRSARIGVE